MGRCSCMPQTKIVPMHDICLHVEGHHDVTDCLGFLPADKLPESAWSQVRARASSPLRETAVHLSCCQCGKQQRLLAARSLLTVGGEAVTCQNLLEL